MSHKKKHQQMELALSTSDKKREISISSKINDSILGSMHSFVSASHSHSIDFSYHSDSSNDGGHSMGSNPKNWHFKEVSIWLKSKHLEMFIPIFQKDHRGHGVDGHKLLELNRDILLNEHPFDLNSNDLYYYVDNEVYSDDDDKKDGKDDISNNKYTEEDKKELIAHLLLEISRLQTKTDDFHADKALDYTDLIEIRRRINHFIEKWERILWIEYYEETFNKLPSKKGIAEEFGVTPIISTLYLECYDNIDQQKQHDLSELFEGFNITHDCIIWWKLILSELKNKPRKSIWIIFAEIAC